MLTALLTRLAPYKLLFEILVIGGLAAGAVIAVHDFLEHERDIGRQEVQARWDHQVAIDKATAAAQAADWQSRLQAATTEGANREETRRSLSASAAAATNSMRDTITRINGAVPGYSVDALRALASTYGQLLAECQGRRTEVAEEAERLNSEKRTLIEAWPRNPSNIPSDLSTSKEQP